MRRRPPLSGPGRVVLALLGAVLWIGCATAALPPAQPASLLAEQAIRQARGLYLYPEQIDSRMMIGSLEALEQAFDPVRFEPQGDSGTLWIGDVTAEVPLDVDPSPNRFRQVLGQVLALVRHEIGPEVADVETDEVSLELIALNGALRSLDRYSTIFSGRRTEDFRIRFSGKLRGIGARIGRRDGRLTAVRVFPESPAAIGGLQDGDAIIGIDGEPTRPLSVGEAVKRIRGEAGTEVALTVLRAEEQLELPIVRGEVRVPSVEASMLEGEGEIGYARIFQVSRTTPVEFREKVEALGRIDGLVLDLRGNSGGSMLAAAAVADYFIERGTIVRVVGRSGVPTGGMRNRAIATRDVLFPFPVAILVDNSTASAAEILSGALEPLPRVTVIGQTTFGKGLVQRVVPIPDQKLLKLTVAEYWLSEDRAINEKGIEPDVVLYPVAADRPGRLAHVPEGAIPYVRAVGVDDTLPIEVAARVVRTGRPSGVRAMRQEALEAVRERLAPMGIAWLEPPDSLPETLPRELEIEGVALELASGEPSGIRIRVRNPNPFEIPNAWLALESPIGFLDGKTVGLGTLGAGSERVGEIRVNPPRGIAVREFPLRVHAASGARPLQSQQLRLHMASAVPDVAIELTLVDAEHLTVTVENLGSQPTGEIRVLVPSVTRTLENLEPGARESRDVPLSGEIESVTIALVGPGAQRGIRIPIPDDRIRVHPPALELQWTRGFRGEQIRIAASSEEGLLEGWLKVDGEKRSYSRWNGLDSGVLQASLDDDDEQIQAMFETISGVAVIDSRFIRAD